MALMCVRVLLHVMSDACSWLPGRHGAQMCDDEGAHLKGSNLLIELVSLLRCWLQYTLYPKIGDLRDETRSRARPRSFSGLTVHTAHA